MIKNNRRHIFWMVNAGMICFISACNNYSVSEKQGESFLKYYAVGIDNNTGTKVIQTSDGYAIMGNFESSPGQKDIFIIFTDEFGRQKSSKPIEIGTEHNDDGNSMIPLGDGYIISGTSYNATQKWGYPANISGDGRVIWWRTYSGYQELVFRDVYPATDGTLIITGYSINRTGDDEQTIIFKTESDGDSLWCRPYPLDGRRTVGEAIIEDQNRYHVLITSTNVSTNVARIRWLNTNDDGRAQTGGFILTPNIRGKDMVRNPAGELFILGNHVDPISRKSTIFLAELEITSMGQITELKDSVSIPYPESLHAESFAPAGQESLAIGGWQINASNNDIMLLLVENDLLFGSLNTYGSPKGSQKSQNIIYTGYDGGFALTGSVDLAGQRTTMLLKIDSEGELR